MPFTFDATHPADNDIVSQYPANERTMRTNLTGAFGAEHDVGSGHHAIPSGSTATRDGFTDWVKGGIYLNTSYTAPRLQIQTAATSPFAWVDVGGSVIPAGTITAFYAATAPTGWTSTSSLDGFALLADSTAGGTKAGSWTISGLTHSHTHSVSASADTGTAFGSGIHDGASGSGTVAHADHQHNVAFSTTSGAASTSAVSSNGTWRPAHAKMLICSRDA